MTSTFRRVLPIVALACLANACFIVSEETDDSNPPVETKPAVVGDIVLIGITPHQDFATSGLVDTALVPKDEAGEALIDTALSIDGSVDDDTMTVDEVDVSETQPEPDKELSAMLDLDSSGSMSSNDPNQLRKDASRQFVDALAPTDAVAVCDFGPNPTEGFSDTRLLSEFTVDRALIDSAIDEVMASGGTPMFQSIVEVLDYYASVYPEGDGNRTLLVLGDGQPNGGGSLDEACLKSQQVGIPINTIGFGPAADKSPVAQQDAVQTLRDLADCSGGAYTGVVDANALGDAFAGFGEAARAGRVTITVRFDPVPTSGTTGGGSVALGNGTQTPVEIQYEFVAP